VRPEGIANVRTRGFTLIELLVVMTIIAIGFLALRPGIVGVRRGAENRKSLRQLVGLLTGARTEAIAGGKLVRVLCDPDASVFWAEAQVDPALDRDEFELLRVLGREQVQLSSGLWLSDLTVAGQAAGAIAQNPIYFYPDGRTDGATVILLDANGREVAVDLAPATGRVELSE
jgi:prepilin-type N-terminal cleavage/methylation domain-containing protein